MGHHSSPAAVIERLLNGGEPFALLHRRTPGRVRSGEGTIEVLTGPVHEVDRIGALPLPERPGIGALALIPFRQIAERGFEVTDDGTPLSVLVPDRVEELPLALALDALPAHAVSVAEGRFDIDDPAYEEIVRTVLREEIGAGQGANFVIRRTFTGRIDGFARRDALALFRRLLAGERGAYWTFVVHTGERTLVGASPEVHVRMHGGTVVMNPISGTYRYPATGPDPQGLLDFLDDPKEIEELSMVVDEELKMMCAVGDRGGVVIGPRLKEMAHLAHTEYELRGRSTLDVREVLRETMFAATVTGSPVENACRVIRRHEPTGRGYYGAALALLGHDATGTQTLDSPILIRTVDIAPDGALRLPVGATLVRGSDPAGEVAETHAKAAGVLAALGQPVTAAPGERPVRGASAASAAPAGRALAADPRVRAALDGRRAGLAPFWLRMQDLAPRRPTGSGRVLVVDGEDTFTSMLAHLLRTTGADVTVERYDAPGLPARAAAHPGPVVLGPGPGDPNDTADPKMRLLRTLTATLLAGPHPGGVLGVCLGHELIAAELGLELHRKAHPFQGAQERIDFFGRPETVGCYNSFTARCDQDTAHELRAHAIEVSRDEATGDVYALRGEGFASVQFHPESVLTLGGPAIVAELLDHSVSSPRSIA
ncbi:anthranilate synthase family protein [Streptomyces xiamenensis]|uniref:anthranilate synthase family protein n=1 Tax=Streptomyces xiamenensis TaxID=408015 RepID=UPI0036C9A5B9